MREQDLRDHLAARVQDRYGISAEEAAKAAADFVGSRTTPPIPVLLDESLLEGAAFAAFALWIGEADPGVVAVREQTQRVLGMAEGIRAAETSWDIGEPGDPAGLLESYRDLEAARAVLAELVSVQYGPSPDLDPTVHNTAFLDGAVAALEELNATDQPHDRSDRDGQRLWSTREAATDLATAESAITLLREDRDRRGYTAEDAATARALRTVLDGARVWDQVTALTMEPAPQLEVGLRPDRVLSHQGWHDSVVLEAGFAGVTIRVERTGDWPAPAYYRFLATEHGATGPLVEVEPEMLGVIAAGDRAPRPDRQHVYQVLGEEVRDHLIGLAEAVTSQRDALHRQENRRLDATLNSTDVQVATAPERSL